MEAPLIKYEVTIHRCPNPKVIAFSAVTQNGLNWLKSCEIYFDSLSKYWLSKVPCTGVLAILDNYDFEEVFAYIKSKDFVQEVENPYAVKSKENSSYDLFVGGYTIK